jgi:hypothetical protein
VFANPLIVDPESATRAENPGMKSREALLDHLDRKLVHST